MNRFFGNLTESLLGALALFFTSVLLIVGIGIGLDAAGTARWRSHNTDPKIGTVWTAGTFSSAREKCYGTNLIVTDGNGLATIANAEVCK